MKRRILDPCHVYFKCFNNVWEHRKQCFLFILIKITRRKQKCGNSHINQSGNSPYSSWCYTCNCMMTCLSVFHTFIETWLLTNQSWHFIKFYFINNYIHILDSFNKYRICTFHLCNVVKSFSFSLLNSFQFRLLSQYTSWDSIKQKEYKRENWNQFDVIWVKITYPIVFMGIQVMNESWCICSASLVKSKNRSSFIF